MMNNADWIADFAVTQADLDRAAERMRAEGSAFDLSELTRRIVRGRLRHGVEDSPAALPAWLLDARIRPWDPAGEWKVGEYVIIWTWSHRRKRSEVMVSDVVQTDASYVYLGVDDTSQPVRKFPRAEAGSPNALLWHDTVWKAIEKLKSGSSEEEQIEAILLESQETILAQIREALRQDNRFVHLSGRWFLRELAAPPTENQLILLAWHLYAAGEAQSTEAMAPHLTPDGPSDAALFGLYLALRDHPQWFQNSAPGQRPLWQVTRQPPANFVARHPAYDPQSYAILCVTGETVTLSTAQRLWENGLLAAVL